MQLGFAGTRVARSSSQQNYPKSMSKHFKFRGNFFGFYWLVVGNRKLQPHVKGSKSHGCSGCSYSMCIPGLICPLHACQGCTFLIYVSTLSVCSCHCTVLQRITLTPCVKKYILTVMKSIRFHSEFLFNWNNLLIKKKK